MATEQGDIIYHHAFLVNEAHGNHASVIEFAESCHPRVMLYAINSLGMRLVFRSKNPDTGAVCYDVAYTADPTSALWNVE